MRSPISQKEQILLNEEIDNLVSQADSSFQRGLFDKALGYYQQLLEIDAQSIHPQASEWKDRLVDCYLIESDGLSRLGAFEDERRLWEALLNFDPMALWSHSEAAHGYLRCLINARAFARASNVLVTFESQILHQPISKTLLYHLALHLLLGDKECHGALNCALNSPSNPAVTTLLQHYEIAKEALASFCAGEDKHLAALLKRIPHRSPYRDFSQLLRALSGPENQRQTQLAHIKPQSVFHPLVKKLTAFYKDKAQAVNTLLSVSRPVQRVLYELGGFPRGSLQMLRKASTCVADNSPGETLNFLLAHKKHFPAATLKSLCYSLVKQYPQGVAIYEKQFSSLSPLETALPAIVAAAKGKDPIQEYTLLCEALRLRDPLLTPVLQAAIWRRVAELVDVIDGEEVEWSGCEALAQSVGLDPDRSTYLRLLQKARKDKSKFYQRWLEQAINAHPHDREFLKLAIEAAIDKGTFKKAVNLANTLLKIDPLNRSIEIVRVRALLAHGRRQLSAGNLDAAGKELAMALKAQVCQTEARVFEVVLTDEQGHSDQARLAFRKLKREAANPLLVYLLLMTEICALYPEPSQAKQRTSKVKSIAGRFTLTKNITSHLLTDCFKHFCRQPLSVGGPAGVSGTDNRDLRLAIELSSSMIKKLVSRFKQHEEFTQSCEFLFNVGCVSLLAWLSERALERFPEDAFFYFYLVWSRSEGDVSRLTDDERYDLGVLYQQSCEQGAGWLQSLLMAFTDGDIEVLNNRATGNTEAEDESEALMAALEKLSMASPEEADGIMASLSPQLRQSVQEMIDFSLDNASSSSTGKKSTDCLNNTDNRTEKNRRAPKNGKRKETGKRKKNKVMHCVNTPAMQQLVLDLV